MLNRKSKIVSAVAIMTIGILAAFIIMAPNGAFVPGVFICLH